MYVEGVRKRRYVRELRMYVKGIREAVRYVQEYRIYR